MKFYDLIYCVIILSLMPLSIIGYIKSKRKEPENPTRYMVIPLFLIAPILVLKIYGELFMISGTLQSILDALLILLAISFFLLLLITSWLAWKRGCFDTSKIRIIIPTLRNCAVAIILIGIIAILVTIFV